MKRLSYVVQTFAAFAAYGFFKLLPLDLASALGGWLLQNLGPLFKRRTSAAEQDLQAAFPDLSAAERKKILKEMWNNLGRVLAEYSHLHTIARHLSVHGAERIVSHIGTGKPALFFSGHFANWETCSLAARREGLPLASVYRKPNNPWVHGLLRHARDAGLQPNVEHIPKGIQAGREIVKILKNGGTVGLLMDQRMNQGVAVPFLGRPVRTAPAIAHFALRFDCPIYPCHVERIRGTQFRLTIEPPLQIRRTDDEDADILHILTQINARLEEWVRARPGQWLWIHRRWRQPSSPAPTP